MKFESTVHDGGHLARQRYSCSQHRPAEHRELYMAWIACLKQMARLLSASGNRAVIEDASSAQQAPCSVDRSNGAPSRRPLRHSISTWQSADRSAVTWSTGMIGCDDSR